MKYSHRSFADFAALSALTLFAVPFVLAQAPVAAERGGARAGNTAWVFNPTVPVPYVEPNRAHWKLTEILAKHTGAANWAEPVLKDDHFFVQYISRAPGEKTLRSFETDTT